MVNRSFRFRCEKNRAARILVFCVALFGAVSWPQTRENGGPTVSLGVEVSLPDRTLFYIPAVGDGEVMGIVPFPKGRFAGIRIVPHTFVDSVRLDVSALTVARRKLQEATCDEVQSWKNEDAGSYEGKENASIVPSGLDRLGLPVFKVKVVRAHGPPPGGFRHPRELICLLWLRICETSIDH